MSARHDCRIFLAYAPRLAAAADPPHEQQAEQEVFPRLLRANVLADLVHTLVHTLILQHARGHAALGERFEERERRVSGKAAFDIHELARFTPQQPEN